MKIKELLTDATKWTKHVYARDKDGIVTTPIDPTAVCWCLRGAILKCYPPEEDKKVLDSIYLLLQNTTTGYNDHPDITFEDIKALVEKLDI